MLSNFEKLAVLLTDEEKEFANDVVTLRGKCEWFGMTPEEFKKYVELLKVVFPEAWQLHQKSVN